jgi:hypothetical protein
MKGNDEIRMTNAELRKECRMNSAEFQCAAIGIPVDRTAARYDGGMRALGFVIWSFLRHWTFVISQRRVDAHTMAS